jgi:hypothetical protein
VFYARSNNILEHVGAELFLAIVPGEASVGSFRSLLTRIKELAAGFTTDMVRGVREMMFGEHSLPPENSGGLFAPW